MLKYNNIKMHFFNCGAWVINPNSFSSAQQGPAVETERCGGPESGTWECLYGSGNSLTGEVPADRPEVIAEIGPGCRCGCIVHLGAVKSRRLIASSSRSCPGRTFWLVQADEKCHIRFKLDFFRLPCATQYLKIRDGDSLSSELIGEFIGGYTRVPDSATSSGSQMLLEFLSDELASMGESCGGGFLAHVQQICTYARENSVDSFICET